jgi:DNA-directed RNA polymerase omega subunit
MECKFLASLAKNTAYNFRQLKSCFPVKGREPMKLIEGFDSNYRYILVAARRARQLQSGAPPVVKPIPASRAALRRTKSARAR